VWSQQQDSWRVPTLRCGLDDDAWERSPEASALCARLTGVKRETGRPLPFNLGRAYELYQELFSSFEDMLKGPDGKWRHLLIVLSGPLSVLPIQTLLTEKPAEDIPAKLEGYRQAKWLGTRQPITMLPSVASLVTLRTYAKQSKATHPFIGFGNPLLVGENGMDKRAWAKLSCQNLGTTAATTVVAQQVAQAISRSLRGGLADVNSLRRVATASRDCRRAVRRGNLQSVRMTAQSISASERPSHG